MGCAPPGTVRSTSISLTPSMRRKSCGSRVGNCVSGAFGGRDPGEPQFPEVARERGLGHVPAALEQQLAEILLAAHDSRVYDLEDCVVSFTLVCHGTESSTAESIMRAGAQDH
jgi:hypothetical protein